MSTPQSRIWLETHKGGLTAAAAVLRSMDRSDVPVASARTQHRRADVSGPINQYGAAPGGTSRLRGAVSRVRMTLMLGQMRGDDFEWAARLMERRRTAYEAFAPVFWKPAKNVTAQHAAFMRSQAEAASAVAVRSDHGFILGAIRPDHYDVDDFAVEPDTAWSSEGRSLLLSVPEFGSLPRPVRVRVVTARQDTAKREMLETLALTPVVRWWVKTLRPEHPAPVAFAQVVLADVEAVFVPAPPVYAPGGPVCVLGDIDVDSAVKAAVEAEQHGAVLAVVTRDCAPAAAPEEEPSLSAAGFDNVAVFFDGTLDVAA